MDRKTPRVSDRSRPRHRRFYDLPLSRGPICETSGAVAGLVAREIGEPEQEVVLTLCLTARGRVFAGTVVGMGTLTASLVHPREVFREAVRANAASIILVHTHPSGDPAPSIEDDEVTHRILCAAELIGIPMIDHLILGASGTYFSYADQALLSLLGQPRGE